LTPQDLTVERRGKVWLVRLNRPRVLNAIRKQMLIELNLTLDLLAGEAPGTEMVLTGEGKAFCAGGDINDLKAMTEGDARIFARLAQNTMKKMTGLDKPIIAAVNGPALGAGFDLVISSDLVVASETATFGSPTLNLGILTPFGGNRRLPRMIGPARAKQLFFTAETMNAATALQLGIVNKVVPPENLLVEARLLAENVSEKAPIALGYIKRLVNQSAVVSSAELDEMEIDLYSKCFRTSDRKEGVDAFLEKRKPAFKGT